jgi:hypothetical protein
MGGGVFREATGRSATIEPERERPDLRRAQIAPLQPFAHWRSSRSRTSPNDAEQPLSPSHARADPVRGGCIDLPVELNQRDSPGPP